MLAEDIAPNRLEKSKQLISKTIEKLGSDRVGIIVYAGNAYPLLPIYDPLLQVCFYKMQSRYGFKSRNCDQRGIAFG